MALPEDKKIKLIVHVAEKVHAVLTESEQELREHEVSPADARHVVEHGWANGVGWWQDPQRQVPGVREMTTVRVTRKHVRQGVRGACKACPIAMALTDAGFTNVIVVMFAGGHYWMSKDFAGFALCLPSKVGHFINRFDNGWDVSPFEFLVPVKPKGGKK